jgi:hypothetical protein
MDNMSSKKASGSACIRSQLWQRGCVMPVRYTNYAIFAPNRKRGSNRPVAWIVAERVMKTADFCLYRERRGPWWYLCWRAYERLGMRRKYNIVYVGCEWWMREKSREKILRRAGWVEPPPEIETMHEMTGWNS